MKDVDSLSLLKKEFISDNNFVNNLSSLNIDCFIHSAFTIDADLDSEVSDDDIKRSKQMDSFLYDSLIKAAIPKVIILSTALSYGERKGMAPAMESDVLKPYNNYTSLKTNSELWVEKLANAYSKSGTTFSILRASPIYDDDYHSNLMPCVYNSDSKCYFLFTESGGYMFSFCHINNLVEAVKGVMEADNLSRFRFEVSNSVSIFNVCDNTDYSALEIVSFLKKKFKEAPVLLGGQPKISLANMFKISQKKVDTNYFDSSKYMNNRRISNDLIRQVVPMRWNMV